VVDAWLANLEKRHLANLTTPEVTRALRALSASYVERRHKVGHSLASSGKRAAFALFYAPLHFLTTQAVVQAVGADRPAPASILDLGCGTGVAGAAWACAVRGTPALTGIDRHPWAVEEARWTYRQLGLRGHARRGDLSRLPPLRPHDAVVAAYLLNELAPAERSLLESRLLSAAARGVGVLVLEPIARAVAPWWRDLAARMRDIGGRADEWRFTLALPLLVQHFDRAAGLDHREVTVRSLYKGVAGDDKTAG
jgi:ubiquinone/menaquinone biosynthesis C-methylase UbiE